jgi:hypothetical protein
MGTSAMVVVKVKLPAVWPSLSSRKRWRKVRAVLRQGNLESRSKKSWSCGTIMG